MSDFKLFLLFSHIQLRQLTGDTADIFLEYVQRNLPEGVSMSVETTELEMIPEFLTQSNPAAES